MGSEQDLNAGSVAGDHVVQLYIRDDVASVTRPVAELRGFQRVRLAPHESRTVHFVIRDQALAFYDTSMARVVESGTFTVFTGDDTVHTSQTQFRFDTPNGATLQLPERCDDYPPRGMLPYGRSEDVRRCAS